MRTRVAVLFGGRSPEHDVSVVTGLQALDALDQQLYEAFPLYIAIDGSWWLGPTLRNRRTYIPSEQDFRNLEPVALEIGPNREGRGRLVPKGPRRLFSKPKITEFDVALLALHGLAGEDGRLQGLLEIANVPYTGMRPLASSVLMDKGATKRLLAGTGIPLLPYAVLDRPASSLIPSAADLNRQFGKLTFPLIVKPMRLGSSIGVARVNTMDELRAALPLIFRLDTQAIVEPFVEHLVEYNIAVASSAGQVITSAIEKPKRVEDLLDFRTKYLSGGGNVGTGDGGTKAPGEHSHGMLSLTRDINPALSPEAEANIRRWAADCFLTVGGSGAPRIDYLSNEKTGEFWLNEVNPCPGSFGFFLWEAAPQPTFFSDLLSNLIEEAQRLHRASQLPEDPTPVEARLFPRR